jgi:hypothetical protein
MAIVSALRWYSPLWLTAIAPNRQADALRKQMEMIPHQAVGQHPPPIPARHPAQDLEEPLPIPIIPKHQGPLIPARDDMEDTASLLDPRRTHHHTNLAPKQTTS